LQPTTGLGEPSCLKSLYPNMQYVVEKFLLAQDVQLFRDAAEEGDPPQPHRLRHTHRDLRHGQRGSRQRRHSLHNRKNSWLQMAFLAWSDPDPTVLFYQIRTFLHAILYSLWNYEL
jgi:hypothetical protein